LKVVLNALEIEEYFTKLELVTSNWNDV